MNAPVFLRQILADKRREVAARKKQLPLLALVQRAVSAPPPRDFAAALRKAKAKNRPPIIAEIKRRSPSKGLLRADFDAADLATQYAEGGATCLSVLTDAPHFGGDTTHLSAARAACELPVLRKDFMLEEWQIYESRALGADAVLLIAAALSLADMQAMAQAAQKMGMAVLTESHNAEELRAALQVADALIGINNRNLHTFELSLQTAETLLPQARAAVPSCLTVAESGIHSFADAARLYDAGADAFLIGEAFMRAEHAGQALQKLFADWRRDSS